jgi:hypothetical protein
MVIPLLLPCPDAPDEGAVAVAAAFEATTVLVGLFNGLFNGLGALE